MKTSIVIVSGFLGAGKTTLIQKMLKKIPSNTKTVLIENDFGDVSVDAALLKSSGIEVREISAGCICCSLSGDFIRQLKEVLERFRPDKVIIEPSGVGKLSDIEKACSDKRIAELAEVTSKITVADVKRCKMYLDNFGEFFEDQIQNADVVILNRSDNLTPPEKTAAAREIIKKLNPHAVITDSMDELPKANTRHELHEHDCTCEHCCTHNHSAKDVFDAVTIRTSRVFSADDLKKRAERMRKTAKGNIIRAKGVVRGESGYLNIQYLPDEIKVEECASKGDMLCVIGSGIDKNELSAIFGGD